MNEQHNTTALCNIALAYIGGNQLENIDDYINDDSRTASLCRVHLPLLIDLALSTCDWSFARKTAQLAQLHTESKTDKTFLFALPSDCLRPTYLVDQEGLIVSYKTSSEGLHCNSANVILYYIARISNPAQWNTDFYNAISLGLASRLAAPLANDIKMQDYFRGLYERELDRAWAKMKNAESRHTSLSEWEMHRKGIEWG